MVGRGDGVDLEGCGVVGLVGVGAGGAAGVAGDSGEAGEQGGEAMGRGSVVEAVMADFAQGVG